MTTIREARREEYDDLVPLLLQAEPSRRALRWSLQNLTDAAYRMDDGEELVGAATMSWRRDPCELVELAIVESRHGQRLGSMLVAWLIEEARRRGKRRFVVGTASTSAGNLLFYQKCGFRVAEVRQDYFWYYDEPRYENGLLVRDMILFEVEL